MTTFTVYLARTGERREITAQDWQSALKATGRPDACLAETQADGAIDVTFAPDAPTIITTRCREGSAAARLAFALSNVCTYLTGRAAADARHVAEGEA